MKQVALLVFVFHREVASNVRSKPSRLDSSDVGWKTKYNVIFTLIQKSLIINS